MYVCGIYARVYTVHTYVDIQCVCLRKSKGGAEDHLQESTILFFGADSLKETQVLPIWLVLLASLL